MFTRSGATWTRQASFSVRALDRGAGPPTGLALSADGRYRARRAREGRARGIHPLRLKWTPRRRTADSQRARLARARFGWSVALSGDGNTALLGTPGDNGAGAVWVFSDSASGWVQDGEKIAAPAGTVSFGKSVAVSSGGETALIGAGEATTGSAFLFKQTGPAWTQQGGNLSPGYVLGDGNFGSSVALSADGGTALVGADGQRAPRSEETPIGPEETAIGAAYPFEFVAESPQPPAVTTGAASSITPTSATLSATVNPEGGTVTRCLFQYGPTRRYGSSVPCYPSPGSGEGPVSVSASLSGLRAGRTYHFRIFARNGSGRSTGADQLFTTEAPQAPTVLTTPASSITSFSATVNGTVNPNGGRVRSCRVEYGTSTYYGRSAPCPLAVGSGESPVAESIPLPDLREYTEYHFRIVARNATGTSYGDDLTFTTTSRGSLVQLGPKTATEGGAIALSADGGTLLVGSPRDDWGGSVRVYVRSGPGWRLQARLGGGPSSDFGQSVAVSADGNTAVVGDPEPNSFAEGWRRVHSIR